MSAPLDDETLAAIEARGPLYAHESFTALIAEVRRLRYWKDEASEVMTGLQELGNALGLPLGQRITGMEACEAVYALKAERDAALAKLDAVRALHRELARCACHSTVCRLCNRVWPCATVRLIDDDSDPCPHHSEHGEGEWHEDRKQPGAFRAQHGGQCADCGDWFHEGDLITLAVQGGYAHQVCPDAPSDTADAHALAQPRCARCGLNHPGEC